MLNPIIAMLHNIVADTWHPILFQESPLPGNAPILRHKSKGHHTVGFGTQVEAEEQAHVLAKQVGCNRLELDVIFEWDGEGIPAEVAFFEAPCNGTRLSVSLGT